MEGIVQRGELVSLQSLTEDTAALSPVGFLVYVKKPAVQVTRIQKL